MWPRRILLIDDEEDIREVTSLVLETTGDFEIFTAPNGRLGIESALREKPDVILLDVMMPGLDGPATLAELRKCPGTREIAVIFLTAKIQAGERRTLSELGAAGIIAKPFDPLTIAEEIVTICRNTQEENP